MGGHRKPSFDEETRNLKPGSPEYEDALRRKKAIEEADKKQYEHAHRLAIRILELTSPLKGLNVSKLSGLSEKRLISIGKAARVLNDELKSASIITGSRSSDKWEEWM